MPGSDDNAFRSRESRVGQKMVAASHWLVARHVVCAPLLGCDCSANKKEDVCLLP